MSNKQQLQTNNIALDGYIARINAAKDVAASLPEVGGGGGNIETCKVNVISNGVGGAILNSFYYLYYSNSELTCLRSYYAKDNTIT